MVKSQLGGVSDDHPFGPEAAGHRGEVRDARWKRGGKPAVDRLKSLLDHVPATVVEDREDDPDLVLNAGQDFPGMHGHASVAAEGDHGVVRAS